MNLRIESYYCFVNVQWVYSLAHKFENITRQIRTGGTKAKVHAIKFQFHGLLKDELDDTHTKA